MLGIVLAAAAVVAAFATWRLAVAPWRSATEEASAERFRSTRRHLKREICKLVPASLAEQDRFRADRELPVLTKEHWIPANPLPLELVSLRLDPAVDDESLTEAKERVRRLLPFHRDRHEIRSYSEAVGLYDRPAIWFNGPSYRLLKVCPAEQDQGCGRPGLELTFAAARYFDAQDTSEFLAYEFAERNAQERRELTRGAYRRWLSDPFDLGRRCAIPGINSLTVRSTASGSFFFMHHRDASKVGVSMNTDHVAPAGEFQPHNDILPVWQKDLDLWRNAMREYAEEFLGNKDSAGRGGQIINYDRDEPYRQLVAARQRGDVVIKFLGIGLDPVSWKPELAIICIWKSQAFDRIFRKMVEVNPEGLLIVGERKGSGYEGLTFDESNVLGYANRETTLAGGRMCLMLAWRWRHELGIPSC